MKKTDLAYIAGLMDGEGCIGIYKNRKHSGKGYTYQLYVSLGQANEWICQYLKFAFGDSITYYNKTRGRQPYWQWSTTTRKALNLLQQVLPYLKLKRPQAELAIKFQLAKKHRSEYERKSDSELAIEEAQAILLRGMHIKHRGGISNANNMP